MSRTSIALAVAAIALSALAGCSQTPSPRTPQSPQQASPAPDFSVTAFDGATYTLADLKGRPIVLNFWSLVCPHCATVVPYLEDLHRKHSSDGLLVLGLAGHGSETALKEKADSLGITYPTGISPDAGRAYRVTGVPMTFFIDREGNIAASILGAQPRDQFEQATQDIL